MFLVAITEDSCPDAAAVLLYESQYYKKSEGLWGLGGLKSIFAVRIIALTWYMV